jgi:hypothetical protein
MAVITALFARETQGWAPDSGEYIFLSLPRFLLVRRKILRLYKADAVTFYKKQAAPGNLRASSHCARWHCFALKLAILLLWLCAEVYIEYV